jgi:tight adherence protein B
VNVLRPDLMAPMLHHLFGHLLVAVIALMEVTGLLLIRRIVGVEV